MIKPFRFACLFLALTCAALAAQAPASRHVILVTIDGFAAFHLADQSIELPNVRALAAAGAAAESSETVFPASRTRLTQRS